MIVHQFEGAAMSANMYSKFTQDNRDTWSYVLFESRLVIDMHLSDTFTIGEGQYY